MANSELYWIQSFYLNNILKMSNFSLWLQILKNLQCFKIRQNLKYFYAKETRIIENQGVSVRPFLALSHAQRTSDFNLERTPHARVWFLVIFAAHHTHTYNLWKSHDGCQFKSKLVLQLPNGIRFLF